MLIIGIALWMIWRTWREQRAEQPHHHHHHHHGEAIRHIDTGHGTVALEVFEDGVPPHWRVRFERGERFAAADVTIEIVRPDGARQAFSLVDRGAYLGSTEEIPEPHEFTATLHLSHGGHGHSYAVTFTEHDNWHDHRHMNLGDEDDAHARAG